MPKHDVTKESSLPKAEEWIIWLSHALDALPAETNFERLLRDTLIVLHHNIANSARRLRGNPGWNIQGSLMDDVGHLEDLARENLAHWKNYYAAHRIGLSKKWEALCDLLEGALNQQVRLARELDQAKSEDGLNIHVTTDRKTGNLIETKF